MSEKNTNAVELGRLGGLAKSAAKAGAARKNGKSLRPLRWRASTGLRRRKTKSGKYQYEVEPGRWVSSQRINQLIKAGKISIAVKI